MVYSGVTYSLPMAVQLLACYSTVMLLDIHSVQIDIIKIQQRAELKCIYINYKTIVDNVPVYLSVFRYEPNTLRNTLPAQNKCCTGQNTDEKSMSCLTYFLCLNRVNFTKPLVLWSFSHKTLNILARVT
jgi:hypothetical protein